MNDVNLRITPSLCALYLDVYMYVSHACVLHARKMCARPTLVGRLGRVNVETCTGDKTEYYTRLDENYFVIENIIYTDTGELHAEAMHLSNKVLRVYMFACNSNNM